MVSNEIERAVKALANAIYDDARKWSNPDSGAMGTSVKAVDGAYDNLIALLARDDARIARLEDVVRDLRHAALQVVEFDEGEDGSDLDASHLFSIRIETLADCIDVLDALDADAPGTTEQEKN